MTPDDLLHAAPAIAKGAAAVGASIPFTAIVKRMLGPAADEVAEQLALEVRRYRFGRQVKCLEKAEQMAKDAGYTPQAVPIKLLFPLLEGASFEDNEDLHTMWAALLANAASPDCTNKVRPGFIAILKQMSPDEAGLLNWIYDQLIPGGTVQLSISEVPKYLGLAPDTDATSPRFDMCMSGLESQGLIDTRNIYNISSYTFTFHEGFRIFFPLRGCAFIEACRPPKPKPEADSNPA